MSTIIKIEKASKQFKRQFGHDYWVYLSDGRIIYHYDDSDLIKRYINGDALIGSKWVSSIPWVAKMEENETWENGYKGYATWNYFKSI